MAIVSNGARVQQEDKLARAGVAGHVETLILSDKCGFAKPAKEIFHIACRSMQSQPSRTIYVGDRPDIDADAACRSGLHGIWLDRRLAAGQSHSRTRIQSLTALPDIVEQLERRLDGRVFH